MLGKPSQGERRKGPAVGSLWLLLFSEASSTAQGAAFPEYRGLPSWEASSWVQFQACAPLLEIEF